MDPTWNNQHNEAGDDPTVRDVRELQIVRPDLNIAGNYLMKPPDHMPQETVKIEYESSDTHTESGSEMTASEADMAKSSELLVDNLWDKAYVDLRSQEPDQLEIYEKTVIFWLEANSMEYVLRETLIDILPQWRKWLCLQVRENYTCPLAVRILKPTPPCDI